MMVPAVEQWGVKVLRIVQYLRTEMSDVRCDVMRCDYALHFSL